MKKALITGITGLKFCFFFCTENFIKSDVETISYKIKQLGFNNSVTSRNRIRFLKKDSQKFLEKISIIEIQDEYLYKWNIKNK